MVEEARRVEIVVGMAFDEKEWSPNTQPMHDGKSPGPMASESISATECGDVL